MQDNYTIKVPCFNGLEIEHIKFTDLICTVVLPVNNLTA